MAKYTVYFQSGNIYAATVEAENEAAAEDKAFEVIFERPDEFEDFVRYNNGPELSSIELADGDAEVDELPIAAE